jgi:hypothetical protein
MFMAFRRAVFAAGALGLAAGGLAGPAFAGETLESKWRNACGWDALHRCTFHALANDRTGVRDCLVRNINKISKSCRMVIEEAHDQGITDASQVHKEPVGAMQAGSASPPPSSAPSP